jgi:hypothetical protein
MPALRITFDTNTLEKIVFPERFADAPDFEAYRIIYAALKDGTIKGFFSEAVVALDAYGKDAKVSMLESARLRSETVSSGAANVTITIGAQWGLKPPISDAFLSRLNGAQAMGMRALIGPRRLGDLHPLPGDLVAYEHYADSAALIAGAEITNAVDLALSKRGLGRAQVINLGLQYGEQNGASGEWWPLGIARARGDSERKMVWKAICEWADGDAVAAHAGYANDFFCTEDRARNSGSSSALHPNNRAWLGTEFGIVFLSIVELADRIKPTTTP